jgi:hypothetical protein
MSWTELSLQVLTIASAQVATIGGATFLFKAILKHWLEKDIEKFKTSLLQEASRDSIRFTHLHQVRAEKIAKLFEHLTHFSKTASLARYAPMMSSLSVGDELKETMNKLNEAEEYYEISKIYFSDTLCKKILEAFNMLYSHLNTARAGERLPFSEIERKTAIMHDLQNDYKTLIQPLLDELRIEFRTILEG